MKNIFIIIILVCTHYSCKRLHGTTNNKFYIKDTTEHLVQPINIRDSIEFYLLDLKMSNVDTIFFYGIMCSHCTENTGELAYIVHKNSNNNTIIKAFDTYKGITQATTFWSEAFRYYSRHRQEIDSTIVFAKANETKSSAHGGYNYLKILVKDEKQEYKYYQFEKSVFETKLWYLFKIADSDLLLIHDRFTFRRD